MATTKIERAAFQLLRAMPCSIRKPLINLGTKIRKNNLKRYKTPINITLYVTSRCNAKCKHCFYANELNKGPELSLEEMNKIARSLKHPLQTLMISGGEPFMRKDLPEICNIFIKHNKTRRISIDTNGILTKHIIKTTKNIVQEHPNIPIHLQISLDGPEKIHNKMRGIKCYSKAISTLDKLEKVAKKHKNLELSTMTTICDLNFDAMEKFAQDFAKKYKNVLHKFNIMRGAKLGTFALGKAVTSTLEPEINLTKTAEELKKLFKRIEKTLVKNKDAIWQSFQKLKWDYMTEMLEKKCKLLDCTARHSFAVIYQNGDVAICEPMKPIGNLKETNFNFEKLWNSEKAEKYKRAAENCFCIHPCNLLDSMSYDKEAISRSLRNG